MPACPGLPVPAAVSSARRSRSTPTRMRVSRSSIDRVDPESRQPESPAPAWGNPLGSPVGSGSTTSSAPAACTGNYRCLPPDRRSEIPAHAWARHLTEELQLAPANVARRLAAVSAFYRWCVLEQHPSRRTPPCTSGGLSSTPTPPPGPELPKLARSARWRSDVRTPPVPLDPRLIGPVPHGAHRRGEQGWSSRAGRGGDRPRRGRAW